MDIVRASARNCAVPDQFLNDIAHSAGRWAKWRMGTVYQVSRKLSRVLPGLRICFDAAAFKKVEDNKWFCRVAFAIKGDQFGFQNTIC